MGSCFSKNKIRDEEKPRCQPIAIYINVTNDDIIKIRNQNIDEHIHEKIDEKICMLKLAEYLGEDHINDLIMLKNLN